MVARRHTWREGRVGVSVDRDSEEQSRRGPWTMAFNLEPLSQSLGDQGPRPRPSTEDEQARPSWKALNSVSSCAVVLCPAEDEALSSACGSENANIAVFGRRTDGKHGQSCHWRSSAHR